MAWAGQNFSASRLLSLVFFFSGALTMPMAVTAAQAFSSATFARSSAWLVVVASLWSSTCTSCSWVACLVSSVAILTRSSSMLSNWSAEWTHCSATMKRWETDDKRFFLSKIIGHEPLKTVSTKGKSWPPQRDQKEKKRSHKELLTNWKQPLAITSELCEHLATGFPAALERFLWRKYSPRSRYPMAAHHNKDLTCSVRVVDIGEERGVKVTFACLLSLCHLGLFSLHAIMAKGWHSPTSSRTQQVHSSLDIHIHGHGLPGFIAYYTSPPGVNLSTAQVSICVHSCQKKKWRKKDKREKTEDRREEREKRREKREDWGASAVSSRALI